VQVLDLEQLWLRERADVGDCLASVQITAMIVEDQGPARGGPARRPGHPKEARLQCICLWTVSLSILEKFKGLLPLEILERRFALATRCTATQGETATQHFVFVKSREDLKEA